MSKEFGDRLILALKRQNITQKELAERINSTEATISRYISGEREPKADILANIATVLKTTSDYLLGIEDEDFDFNNTHRLLARNSSRLTDEQKRELITALLGG